MASYYRINIEEKHVDNGFFITCKSDNKGKFKLILIDDKGSILFHEESQRGHYDPLVTEIVLFFTNFDTYHASSPSNSPRVQRRKSVVLSESKDVPEIDPDEPYPSIFSKLDGFSPTKKSLSAGQYLICVHGDNFIGKTNVELLVCLSNNTIPEVSEIMETDMSLLKSKQAMNSFKSDYVKVTQLTRHCFISI